MRDLVDTPLARWTCPIVAIAGAINGVWIPTAILAAITIYAWKVHLR